MHLHPVDDLKVQRVLNLDVVGYPCRIYAWINLLGYIEGIVQMSHQGDSRIDTSSGLFKGGARVRKTDHNVLFSGPLDKRNYPIQLRRYIPNLYLAFGS